MVKKLQMDKMVHEKLASFESQQFSSASDAQQWLEQAGYQVHLERA